MEASKEGEETQGLVDTPQEEEKEQEKMPPSLDMPVNAATSGNVEGQRQTSLADMAESLYEFLETTYTNARLPYKYRLHTEYDVLKRSIYVVRFVVMCSAINTKMLNPNYPIMVSEGASSDSFPDTKPFDYNSATYFLPMSSLLGVAIASVFLGTISDRVGRKRVLIILAWISAVGSIVKYYTKDTFWGFCAAQFVFGFFLGNLPVGMAYVGDVYTSKKDKELELGLLVSCYVIGNSGGGIIAILMNGSGLFAPLWVGAGLMGVSALFTQWYMIEAGDVRLEHSETEKLFKEEEELEERPVEIDKKALWNIVGGATADNFGSTGLFPLCLSPLAIEHYLFDFTGAEPPKDPIMSVTGYQWLSVCVAFMVVPSTQVTPYFFRKCGVAGTCVMGNILTALVTFALLMIGNAPATEAWFGIFVAVMYIGFPFTVFSQLTTGPMLDIIAPEDKIGYVQGLNNAAMNFGMAVAPWLFGLLADSAGTNISIIVGIAVSLLAAAINSPLMCDSRFGRTKELPPSSKRALQEEDPVFVEKALSGDVVNQELLASYNLARLRKGKAPIIPRVKPYTEDKADKMQDLRKNAIEAFRQRRDILDMCLTALSDPNNTKTTEEFCQLMNSSIESSHDQAQVATKDLGQWIGDYLQDTGYNPHTQSAILKLMILAAFPPINTDEKYTPDNLESALVKSRRVFNQYVELTERKERNWGFRDALGKGSSVVFYS